MWLFALVSDREISNRLAASFKDGLVRPSLVVSKLQAMQRQNPLQQAIQELGRIGKTWHILHYIDDPPLQTTGVGRAEQG
jgi:TnpA family transposase